MNTSGKHSAASGFSGTPTPWLTHRSHATIRGITLMETIGVAVVVAIIAASLIPKVIKRIDQGYIDREVAELSTIADAYSQFCLVNKRIPGPSSNDWATNVANRL